MKIVLYCIVVGTILLQQGLRAYCNTRYPTEYVNMPIHSYSPYNLYVKRPYALLRQKTSGAFIRSLTHRSYLSIPSENATKKLR